MQKWSLLPTEIINQIIIYVDENYDLQEKQNDLSQCALTCRSWKEIAQPLLFSRIILKNFEIAIESLLRLMMNNNMLGAYVKELHNWNEIKLASLITINSLFPNLDKIELRWNDFRYRFFCKLITEEGKFRNLKSIPPPEEDYGHADMYIECLFTLKSQITEVYLEDDDNEERGTYLKLCDELYQFPNLQSVCIHQSCNASSQNIMDYVESLTAHDNLLYLKRLKLIVSGQNHLHLPFEKLRDVQPSTKIKDITIAVNSFQDLGYTNEQFMLYIMKKFPNPSRIRLQWNDCIHRYHMTNGQNQDYIERPTTITLIHFLQYLCKIQDCDALNILYVENAAGIIKDLFSSMSLQTKVKIPQIHITAKAYGNQETSPTETNIGVNNNAVDDTRTIFIEFSTSSIARFKQLLLNLFQEAACFFTEATLKIDTIGELILCLNHIGKYCDKLEKLEIEGDDLLENSLEVLEKVSDEAKNYSVKKLCISGSGLTPDQLCFISARFPCLENLIINISFGSPNGNYMFMDGEITVSTFLNNSSLKHLTINPEKNFGHPDLNGIQVNITTDSGQSDRISFYTEEDFYAGERVRYYFVPLVEFDDSNRNKNWIVWNIHCRSIEKLNVIFHETVMRNGKKVRHPKTLTLSF